MSFRLRLLVLVALTIGLTVGLVTWIVSETTRRAFEALDNQRTATLVGQFRREFDQSGNEIVRRVEGIARAEGTARIAIDLSRPEPDYSTYVSEAGTLAAAHGLDFLQLVAPDGTIVSSAQWPASFGYEAELFGHEKPPAQAAK